MAGRQVQVDFCDSKLDANATTQLRHQGLPERLRARRHPFRNALDDLADVDGCKNATGKAIGIPDLAAFAVPAARLDDPDTYINRGATASTLWRPPRHNPQTIHEPTSATPRYLLHDAVQRACHGVYVYDSDVPDAQGADFLLPNFQGDEGLGIKARRPVAPTAESGGRCRRAHSPARSSRRSRRRGSSFALPAPGQLPQNTILLEREAKLQGVNSVNVWACNYSGCYDS